MKLRTFSPCRIRGGAIPIRHVARVSKVRFLTNGTVKFYNSTKGFGFITPDDGGKDAFVHVSAVERAGLSSLNDGQKLSYDVEAGRDGRESAVNLQLVWWIGRSGGPTTWPKLCPRTQLSNQKEWI